ncbi:cell division protein FtsA [Azonexus hydrophilus]|jgi:cell division protein FtsA|uniref:cell division protein FtsA n=1 Tax=Azonexus hydrophilus TaxID=418702 RepID=UPI001965F7F5|nr:cell division protein FtsA [Azonexus hydrophilus]
MSRDNKDLVVGLDIGTSRIIALVADLDQEGRLNVIGVGSQESRGLKKGAVVNIEEAVHTISRVIQEVELMADCKVSHVYTGIAGSHIKSFNSNGMVAIKDKEVTQADVERVIETARAMPIPADQEILHILTQEFVIDGQDSIREPIGMSGMRLEVKTHIVTGAVSAAQNIVKCVRRCGLEANDLVLQPLASSYAVLSEDEKDLGVCLIDIGGGTTDIAVWTQGAIRHTSVIPIAGDQVTNDIAMALRTPTREAEDIKIRFGCALTHMADASESIDVAGVDDRPSRKLSRRALADVIQPRVEELFELIQHELRRAGFEDVLSSGIVLTGGASAMPGMVELGEEIFHMPVRLGSPKYTGSLADVVQSPRFSTAYGLLLEAQTQRRRGQKIQEKRGVSDVFSSMKQWFSKNF